MVRVVTAPDALANAMITADGGRVITAPDALANAMITAIYLKTGVPENPLPDGPDPYLNF